MTYFTTLNSMRASLKNGSALLLPISIMASAPNAFAQAHEIDEIIVVTGSPLVQTLDDAMAGLSVLSGDELQDRLAGTIGETLKSEPGVSSTFFGAGASRPIIRGQDGDRIRVLNNGIGSIDASSSSPDHAVAAEVAQAERVEVLRGASVLRYGSSGSGGIVNVIDGRIPDHIPEEGHESALRAGYSTVDEGYIVAGSTDIGLSDNIAVHLDFTRKDAGDFNIPVPSESAILRRLEGEEVEEDEEGETLENSFSESESYTGGVSWIGNRGFLGVSVSKLDSLYGIPGGHGHEEEEEGQEEEGDEEVVTIDIDQLRFDINGALEFNSAIEKIQLFAGYADFEQIEFEGDEVGTVFTNEGGELRLEAIQRARGNWNAAYGLHFRTRDFSAIGDEAFVPPTTTTQLAAYTFQQADLGEHHVEGAVRFEHIDQEDVQAQTTREFDLFSVSLGGDYHVNDALRIGGTIFRTERAPTSDELFSNGPHLATQQFEVGNSLLGKETATGVEAIVGLDIAGFEIGLNGFFTDYEDFIFLRDTDMEEDELRLAEFTADDAQFKGFELQLQAPKASIGAVEVTSDVLVEYVEAETNLGPLPRIPPLSVLTGIEADWNDFNLRAELDFADNVSTVSEFEIPTNSYTLTNLFLGYDLPIEQRVRLSASLNNVFDVEARQHTSFLKDQVPLPGRNLKLAVKAQF